MGSFTINYHLPPTNHFTLHSVHLLEDLALLAADPHAHTGAELRELRAELVEGLLVLRRVDDHHHVEETAGDGLADVEDVDVFLGEVGAGLGENANGVLTDDGDDNLFHGDFTATSL